MQATVNADKKAQEIELQVVSQVLREHRARGLEKLESIEKKKEAEFQLKVKEQNNEIQGLRMNMVKVEYQMRILQQHLQVAISETDTVTKSAYMATVSLEEQLKTSQSDNKTLGMVIERFKKALEESVHSLEETQKSKLKTDAELADVVQKLHHQTSVVEDCMKCACRKKKEADAAFETMRKELGEQAETLTQQVAKTNQNRQGMGQGQREGIGQR